MSDFIEITLLLLKLLPGEELLGMHEDIVHHPYRLRDLESCGGVHPVL
jgi:hypothetical protein